MLKRNDKVYFESQHWIVYLNNRNNIKIYNPTTETKYDYFSDIYGKRNEVPMFVQDKCKEIHAMWHDGSIWAWMESYARKKAPRKK